MKVNCIICPKSCVVTVEEEGGKLHSHGNLCPRGKVYAEQEYICPKRTLTTTVMAGKVPVPVKTSKPVPKKDMFLILSIIKNLKPKLPVKMGQVFLKDVLGSGADIVALRSIGEDGE